MKAKLWILTDFCDVTHKIIEKERSFKALMEFCTFVKPKPPIRNKKLITSSGNERGSGTVNALALIAVLITITILISFSLKILIGYQQAQTSLDMAVLSGASSLIDGFATTQSADPCVSVASVAKSNGLNISTCKVQELDVLATANPVLSAGLFHFKIAIRSRAGPQFEIFTPNF